MSDLSYVRDEMIPERAPPVSSSGVIGWMRENLFSGWLNTLLTLGSLYFLWSLISHLLPWFWSPTWNGTSLQNCREIIAEAGKQEGACWGVIHERWPQILFGFYPVELRWRPIVAFVLLFVALAPVLFAHLVPRRLIWVTIAYPFIFPWLLWGGTFWAPVTAALGFAVGWAVYRLALRPLGNLGAVVTGVLGALIWWFVLAGPVTEALASVAPLALEPVRSRLFGGFLLSLTIGVVAIGASLPLGILLALGRQSDLLIVKSLSVGFIEFIRGVPLITILFVASVLLNIFLPPGTDFDIILRVMIMATLFASAYMAEVIRGGLAALPKGQYEAAAALGLDYWKSQRLVIMPQALKISIPGIVGVFIGMYKDTTLVSIIALLDPLGLTNTIRADADWNGIVWELYGFVALLFWIGTFSMSRYSMYLERRLRTEHR